MDEIRRGPGRPPKYESVSDAATEAVRSRPNRKPFGVMDQRLAYEQRPNYHRHWFNDAKDRVQRALDAGYAHVIDKEGKNVSTVVGVAEGGGPLNGFLMEIPEEWYQEDMAAQQAQINAKEATMRRGELEMQPGDGRYVPAQGISIKHG